MSHFGDVLPSQSKLNQTQLRQKKKEQSKLKQKNTQKKNEIFTKTHTHN